MRNRIVTLTGIFEGACSICCGKQEINDMALVPVELIIERKNKVGAKERLFPSKDSVKEDGSKCGPWSWRERREAELYRRKA